MTDKDPLNVIVTGVGGQGSGGQKGLETILKNIHNYTEMNISQFGKDEKKTRIGYKDKQKKVSFLECALIHKSTV